MTPPTLSTAAGRRLFTDNEPMDMYESDGVTWEDVIAIEAEAAQQSKALRLPSVEALAAAIHDAGPYQLDGGVPDVCNRYPEHQALAAAILAALAQQPEER